MVASWALGDFYTSFASTTKSAVIAASLPSHNPSLPMRVVRVQSLDPLPGALTCVGLWFDVAAAASHGEEAVAAAWVF